MFHLLSLKSDIPTTQKYYLRGVPCVKYGGFPIVVNICIYLFYL